MFHEESSVRLGVTVPPQSANRDLLSLEQRLECGSEFGAHFSPKTKNSSISLFDRPNQRRQEYLSLWISLSAPPFSPKSALFRWMEQGYCLGWTTRLSLGEHQGRLID